MSARKIDSANGFSTTSHPSKTVLSVPTGGVRIRKNGIEFRSPSPITPWKEMTLELQSPRDSRKVHCTGVVVACDGNRHAGYLVSMLFTNGPRQSQAILTSLAAGL